MIRIILSEFSVYGQRFKVFPFRPVVLAAVPVQIGETDQSICDKRIELIRINLSKPPVSAKFHLIILFRLVVSVGIMGQIVEIVRLSCRIGNKSIGMILSTLFECSKCLFRIFLPRHIVFAALAAHNVEKVLRIRDIGIESIRIIFSEFLIDRQCLKKFFFRPVIMTEVDVQISEHIQSDCDIGIDFLRIIFREFAADGQNLKIFLFREIFFVVIAVQYGKKIQRISDIWIEFLRIVFREFLV